MPIMRAAMADRFNYPTWNILNFDRSSRQPLHDQLYLQLLSAIVTGQVVRGTRLPPSRKLATELGVSRNTVIHAYERLAAEGYLRHKVGAGTFVEESLPEDYQLRSATDGKADAVQATLSRRGEQVSRIGVSMRLDQHDLSPGVPAIDQFPFDRFTAISNRYWKSLPAVDLGYGEPGGLKKLRQQISLYLGEARGVTCEPEQVIVLSGTLPGITLIAQLLLDPGDVAVLEDPSFITEVATLIANGVRPINVPIDRSGLDLARAGAEAQQARLIAVTPVGQFPFGSIMGMERRQALLSWAYERKAWIFEDDFNSEIRWGGQPLPPLAALDRRGQVIYASSFNRVLAPGIRLGYVVVPADLVDAFGAAQQALGYHVPTPLQHMVANFMESGDLAAHLRRMRLIYQERAELLAHCLREQFGDLFEVPDIQAGLYLTMFSRSDIDDVAISNAALRYKLDVPALSRYCRSDQVLRGFIYGFGNTPPARIPRCVKNFAKAVDAVAGSRMPAPQADLRAAGARISRTAS